MTILGIGTARSGTVSLAKLLQAQGLDVTHEDTTVLPVDKSRKPYLYDRAKKRLSHHDGDVACWLINRIFDLMTGTEAKCIALRRGRKHTVRSLMQRFDEHRIRTSRPYSGIFFPSIETGSVKDAWTKYWQWAQQRIAQVKATYPERTVVVNTEDLETRRAQRRIADLLSIRWSHVPDCHHNRSKAYA